MAILRGFPPSNTISPSVRITEKDLSFIAPEQSFHRAGLVGFASKGPINVPTVIRTQRQLNTVFGFPHPDVGDPYLIYAASQYLLISNELYVVRVAETEAVSDEQATIAQVDVPIAGTEINIISQNFIEGGDSLTLDRPLFFKWRINGVLSTKTLVLSDTFAGIGGTGIYTVDEAVEELNKQLDAVSDEMNFDGILFYNTAPGAGGHFALKGTFAYGPEGSVELVSVADSMYGGANEPNPMVGRIGVGLGLGMIQATTVGTMDRYPDDSGTTSGTYDFTSIVNPYLDIVVDGTDQVAVDNVVQTIDFTTAGIVGVMTIADIVTAINAMKVENGGTLPGGWTAYATGDQLSFRTGDDDGYGGWGRDARLLVKTTGVYAVFGFSGITASGSIEGGKYRSGTPYPTAVSGGADVEDAAYVTGDVDSSVNCFTITADSAGIEGNNTKVVIVNDISTNTFSMDVYSSGVQMESWGGLTKLTSSRYYVETFLALVSDFIRVVDNTATSAPPLGNTGDSYYQLTGGSDGIPSDPDRQDALLIGSLLGYTGIYALSEPEQIDIDLIAVPGHSSTTVVTELLYLCQSVRMDCLAIIDPPFGLTVHEIVAWQNGTHPYNTTRFDSDFGALYWPWVKIRDNTNQVDVWVPPSGSIMAVYARSDNLSAPWYAPAGTTRGIVPGISDVFNRPTLEERDEMYGNRNAINPIVQFADLTDFMVWGQKTLQRRPTALDRVNVRRLMFVCEKRIRAACRDLLFEPHDEILRNRFVALATSILSEIRVGRGIHDFIIKCDAELNTPDVIDRNELRARIGIQPVRAAEFIFIEFSIHRTDSWGEGVDNF